MYIVCIVVLVFAVLALIFVAVRFVKKNPAACGCSDVETIEKEVLSLAEVVSFFRQPEILKKLQESTNLIAVAVKEKQDDGKICVTLCLYLKDSSTLQMPLRRYVVSRLAEDLQNIFGDKDMLVVQ